MCLKHLRCAKELPLCAVLGGVPASFPAYKCPISLPRTALCVPRTARVPPASPGTCAQLALSSGLSVLLFPRLSLLSFSLPLF